MREKDSYFIEIESAGKTGLGECGLLRGLSADDRSGYEEQLQALCEGIALGWEHWNPALAQWPSIRGGLEMALIDLESENHILYPSDFTDGYERQSINGLIWMGDYDYMMEQVRERIERGFLVLKMKIGTLDLEAELKILEQIRKEYSAAELQLRVDANGAFSPAEALPILQRLDQLRVHSIEQPIAKGQGKAMARLCAQSPLPIALDEELIGVFDKAKQEALLDLIKPKFIILKPSFLGGFAAAEQWIKMAEERSIGWWVTSALESNLGLSAIAQWNYNLYGYLASGLGTGSLYLNNFPSPLYLKRGTIAYNPQEKWDLSALYQNWQ